MAISHQDAMPSSASTFVCALCHCVGLLQVPSPSDVDRVLVSSCSPGDESATLIDIHDAPSPLSSTAPSSDGDWNDVTMGHDVPTFGVVQLKAGFVRLYQLVTALVVQVTVIGSDIVSLKDRITAVEGTQATALVHGQVTGALTRQVNELCERIASQEDRIASLELSQRAETDSYKKTVQELTTKLDNMKVDDDRKSRDDTLKNLCQSFKNFQQSMECQAARVTGVKADTARKIALLQSGLAGVHAELAAVKTAAVRVNASSTSQAAKDVQKAQILAGIAQRRDDAKMAEEKLCPLLPVAARSSACATVFEDIPTASTSSGGSPITLINYNKTEETTVNIAKEPLIIARLNVAQPGANKIPATPMIPIPTIPMERLIPAKGNGKENKSCSSSTTTLQCTKTSQPGAGLPSKISTLPKPRRSMLPAPRKSHLPGLAKHTVVVDGSSPNEVKTADHLPGGSETQMEQPKTIEFAPTATSRPPLDCALSTQVVKEPLAALPASSSLARLDATLQAMQVDGDDLLTRMSALDYSSDDLGFSAIAPIHTKTKTITKYESLYVSSKQRNVDVKPSRRPLKSTLTTLAGNEVSLPASSSLAALDAALQMLHGEGDILTLMPGPDYGSVDFSFSAVTPILINETTLQARKHLRIPDETLDCETLAKAVGQVASCLGKSSQRVFLSRRGPLSVLGLT